MNSGPPRSGKSKGRDGVRNILTRSTYRGEHLCGVHDTRNGIKRSDEE